MSPLENPSEIVSLGLIKQKASCDIQSKLVPFYVVLSGELQIQNKEGLIQVLSPVRWCESQYLRTDERKLRKEEAEQCSNPLL